MSQTKPAKSTWGNQASDPWSALKELYAHRKQQRPSWVYSRLEAGLPVPPEFKPHVEAYKAWRGHPNEDTFFMTNFISPEGDALDESVNDL